MRRKTMQELYKSSEEFRSDAIKHEMKHCAGTNGDACDDTREMSAPLYSQEEIDQYAHECALPAKAPLSPEDFARKRAHDTEMPKIEGILGIIKEDMMRRDPKSFIPRDYEKGPGKE